MVCKDCTEKPLVRGIKFVKCIKCGKDCHIMYGDFDICEECSDEFGVCKRCGKKVITKSNTDINLKSLYDSDNVTIDLLKNCEGITSIRISYFENNHWVGESWVDNVFSQDNASFRKDF
jgi:hypothetical protein